MKPADWNDKRTKVLVPFDFSEACLRAVEVAQSFVASDEAITVLHVAVPPMSSYSGLLRSDHEPERSRNAAHTRLSALMTDQGFGVRVQTRYGSPAEEILAWAEDASTELIVIPSRSRSGLSRWLMGSVAERVVRHAHCAVLVLREALDDAASGED